MSPLQLTNFTVWGREWFPDGWDGLARLCRTHHLAGIELLGSGATPHTAPPPALVRGVHLSSMGSWLRHVGLDVADFGAGASRYAAAASYSELVRLRADELGRSAWLRPDYVVWHGSYAPFPQVFGGPHQLDAEQFITHLAALIRAVLDEAAPAFSVYLENAFGLGVDYEHPDHVAALMDALRGYPVGLVLDTGHYLNRHRELTDEPAACAALARLAGDLHHRGIVIDAVHLHWTPPALVPGDALAHVQALAHSEFTADERSQAASALFEQCDQHRPFRSAAVRQAIDALAPKVIVHELGAMSLSEHEAWLAHQLLAQG